MLLNCKDKSRTRSEFEDIFTVNWNCGSDYVDYSGYTDNINVSGSLSWPASIRFFEKIGASQDVLNTLRNGHSSNLTSEVPRYERGNNKSFKENEEFGIGEVMKLIKLGKVKIVSEKPYVVNPLSVAVQRRKSRLVLDCSFLNSFVEVPRFKYEDVLDGLNYFRKGCYLIQWDLKDGYHQIKISEEFQKYLGFKINYKGEIIYCQYTVGPFGLRDLPYVYTKIFCVLVRHWRQIGLLVIKFLDDGICFSCNEAKAIEASDHIR